MQRRSHIWTSVYFLSALLVATPAVDVLTQVWPLQPGSMVWRYGFLGFLGNNLLTPLLGLTLAGVAAMLAESRLALRLLSWTALAAGVGLLALLAFFSLDVLQLRASVAPEARPAFQVGAAIAAGKYVVAVLGYGLLGRAAWRSLPKQVRAAPPVTTRAASRGLVRSAPLAGEILG